MAVANSGFLKVPAKQLCAGAAYLNLIVENDQQHRLARRGVVLRPATQFLVVDEIDRSLEHQLIQMVT
jgi:hypothetical protein